MGNLLPTALTSRLLWKYTLSMEKSMRPTKEYLKRRLLCEMMTLVVTLLRKFTFSRYIKEHFVESTPWFVSNTPWKMTWALFTTSWSAMTKMLRHCWPRRRLYMTLFLCLWRNWKTAGRNLANLLNWEATSYISRTGCTSIWTVWRRRRPGLCSLEERWPPINSQGQALKLDSDWNNITKERQRLMVVKRSSSCSMKMDNDWLLSNQSTNLKYSELIRRCRTRNIFCCRHGRVRRSRCKRRWTGCCGAIKLLSLNSGWPRRKTSWGQRLLERIRMMLRYGVFKMVIIINSDADQNSWRLWGDCRKSKWKDRQAEGRCWGFTKGRQRVWCGYQLQIGWDSRPLPRHAGICPLSPTCPDRKQEIPRVP